MEAAARNRKNALAFLQTLVTPGGFQIRELGYQTIANIQLLGLEFSQPADAAGKPLELTPPQKRVRRDSVHAYLFIQAAPLVDVARAIRAHSKLLDTMPPAEALDEFMVTVVEPWLATIPPDGITAAYEQLAQLDEIDAAVVKATPADAQKKSGPE